ncbi:MAG TPA: ATP-dependent helicase [Melioribacteraceae bacterium]|nr:ATP-dependent helicase [Melioribacteraceae bacterium]
MALTDEQLVPINSTVENRLVLAGPGTGKSFTIIGFITDLINAKGIDPKRIFVLTFTRAATAELKTKISKELKIAEDLPYVFTLHGFSLRQLMKNSRRISTLPSNFVIADDYEERNIILEDIKVLLNSNIKEIRRLFNLLSANWETLNADRDDWEQNFDSPEFLGAWKEHREIYGYGLRSELVYQFKNILESTTEISLDGPIEYLIVDEYQDLNRCDLRVIETLFSKGAKLFVAGDDDQSIYGFRYAYPEGIRNFTNVIKNSKSFHITECQRCDPKILELASNVIRQDYKRISKTIKSTSKSIGHTALLKFATQYEEAENISRIIKEIIDNKISKEEEVIILLRSDHNKCFSTVLTSKLLANNLKVNANTSLYDIFDSNLGRYLISILKLYDNHENGLAYRVILNLVNGIGGVTINSIYNLAAKNRSDFVSILQKIKNGEETDIKNLSKVQETLKYIDELLDSLKAKADNFNEQVQLLKELFESHSKEFIDSLLDIITRQKITSIGGLNTFINDLFGPAEPLDQDVDGVRIMSMHQAKGLTAEVVFIVACEEEYIPGKNDIDEERRLLYVSLTRAKHYLFISYCVDRIDQQRHTGYKKIDTTKRNLSRYLEGIPNIKSEIGINYKLDAS